MAIHCRAVKNSLRGTIPNSQILSKITVLEKSPSHFFFLNIFWGDFFYFFFFSYSHFLYANFSIFRHHWIIRLFFHPCQNYVTKNKIMIYHKEYSLSKVRVCNSSKWRHYFFCFSLMYTVEYLYRRFCCLDDAKYSGELSSSGTISRQASLRSIDFCLFSKLYQIKFNAEATSQ